MSIRSKILEQITKVAAEQKKPLQDLNDNLILLNSGLDSLCFAILVTRLEDELGFDPFTVAEDVYFPSTLGDFIRYYEDAAAKTGTETLAG